MDKAEFWSTKSPLPEWHAIVFTHPAFDAPFRLVANQFAPVTLGGQVHTPAPMSIKPPDSKGDTQPKLTLIFPRQVVGREFKRQLRLVTASASRDPISVTYSVYLGDTAAPEIVWQLYAAEAGGVTFNQDSVQVSATDDNPMRRAVAPIYDPGVFTGLELI
jgi:protein involved in polysaccharide export with SLBB domain